jgi:transposase
MTRLFLDRIDGLMAPILSARDLLESIPGFSQIVAEIFIAETGGDMTQFPTPEQLASWAGVSPRLQRVRRPGQVHQNQTGEPLPQRRSRHRRVEPGTVQTNLLLGEVPAPGL